MSNHEPQGISKITEGWESTQPPSPPSKRKAGRKPLLDIERRQVKWHGCYTPAEAKAIKAKALAAGLSASDYIRHAVLNRELKTVPAVNKITYDELLKIGINLNQCCKLMHIGKRDDEALKTSMQALIAKLAEIRKELLGVPNANI